MSETWKQVVALVVFLVVVFAVGNIGTPVTLKAVGPGAWYEGLRKPAWNPPDVVFGPVWTTLFAMMSVEAWLVWRDGGIAAHKLALGLFLVQLLLNGAWTLIFFGGFRVGLAMAEIVLLWGAILATMVLFWRVRAAAGWLMLPYFLWVSYASSLNAGIWWLNRR